MKRRRIRLAARKQQQCRQSTIVLASLAAALFCALLYRLQACSKTHILFGFKLNSTEIASVFTLNLSTVKNGDNQVKTSASVQLQQQQQQQQQQPAVAAATVANDDLISSSHSCAERRAALLDRAGEGNRTREVYTLYLSNIAHFLPNFLLEPMDDEDELWDRAQAATRGALFVGARSGSTSMCNVAGDFYIREDAAQLRKALGIWTNADAMRDFTGLCQIGHETAILKQISLSWRQSDALTAFIMRDPLQRMISSYRYGEFNEFETMMHTMATSMSFVDYCRLYRNFELTHMSPYVRCRSAANRVFSGSDDVRSEHDDTQSKNQLWAYLLCLWNAPEEERVASLHWWLSEDRLRKLFTVIGVFEERDDFIRALYVARGGVSSLWGRPHAEFEERTFNRSYLQSLNLYPHQEPLLASPENRKGINPLCNPPHWNARNLTRAVRAPPSTVEQAKCRDILHLDYKFYEAIKCLAQEQKLVFNRRFPQIAKAKLQECYHVHY